LIQLAENIRIRRLYSRKERLVLSSSFLLIGTSTIDLLLALCILRISSARGRIIKFNPTDHSHG